MSEHKGEIIKLSLSGGLLLIFSLISHFTALPLTAKIILFGVLFVFCGFNVLKEAAENLLHGKIFDENFLMSIASIGAFIIGQYSEAVFVLLFFGIGELFEEIAGENSKKNIKSLLDIAPDTATVLNGQEEKKVLSKDVSVGDTIAVYPGERIALDGEIIKGSSFTDNSALTGESVPIAARVGDCVYSGCINKTSKIYIKVTKPFYESTANKILSLVENSKEKKAKAQKFITKFSKFYTPIVCICAVLLAVIPSLITGEFKVWIYRSLMFLVVSCPCSLVVSVPLAYFVGLGASAKHGILVKGATYLESAAGINTAVFDKTGTLTKGEFKVVAVHKERVSEEKILKLAACAESGSLHPIAASIKGAYKGALFEDIKDINEITGKGIKAVINGKTVLLGNGELMKENNINYKDCTLFGTVIHIARENEYLGHIVISDTVKKDAKESIAALNKMNIKTVMLSGDNQTTVQDVAKSLDINEFYGNLKPEDKVKLLESKLNKNGTVAFFGDGINDAPVLSRADIGVAMGALGSDAAIAAADIVLMEDKLIGILKCLKIAKRTQKTVKQNIALSLFVKFTVLFLCSFGIGVTNMWIASFADVGVLMLCVLNSVFSTGRLKEKPKQ